MTQTNADHLSYWETAWTRPTQGWQVKDAHPVLIKYLDKLTGKNTDKRILVPLCGKSVDLKWLYESGYNVVGIEAVYSAVDNYFREHNFDFEALPLPNGKGTIFQTKDSRLQVFVCDFFDPPKKALGTFDSVWDRGAFTAVHQRDRDRYIAAVKGLLKPSFCYLLDVVEYDPTLGFNGPPRSVSVPEIEHHFGAFCSIEMLERNDVYGPRARDNWKITWLYSNIAFLTPNKAL